MRKNEVESYNIPLTLNESTDLYLAFNRVSVNFIGNKIDGRWHANINVYDRYDFDIEKINEINGLTQLVGSAAGTVAALDMDYALSSIKSYEINVNFNIIR